MKKLAILIPSYKRPEVLETTLKGLLNNITQDEGYDIRIAVGLNQVSPEDTQIVSRYNSIFNGVGITLDSIPYASNIGKAAILNVLFKIYGYQADLVITMDNDMVILKPWLHHVSQCDSIDYDIMGFCSARFWAHDPAREKCPEVIQGGHTFYVPYSVAGGMMLFHHQFLEDHPWTNHGGVYGRDDATMCLLTQKKYVLHSGEDWLIHDPLNSSTHKLKVYEDNKKELYKKGITVFPIGWDEV
jgi:cellulose synthase/poly-beta-1,6-N-acetylglucosamine synthase-like glycosyltransferase